MKSESEIVRGWEERFLGGDHSDDEGVLRILKAEVKEKGTPLLFRTASNLKTFVFLKENGVNLIQRADDGDIILSEISRPIDIDAYHWLAKEFARNGAIDFAEEEGITPLSSMIKAGELTKARILLENGASIHTFGTIARYGGSRLDIPTQAINCFNDEGKYQDVQITSIEALKLLQEFGYAPSREEVERLIDEARLYRPLVADWIAKNLLKS